jgi:predicted MFS family arabinose efflux permease
MLTREPQAVMICVSLVRGFGFGLCGVATGALTATLLPPGRRGEGLGLLGIVSGVPAIVALPAGVWLAGHHLATAAAALAAVSGLLPLVAIRWLPGGHEARRREARQSARVRPAPGARDSWRLAGAALRLPLIFAAATIAAGVLDSFLPLAKGIPSDLCSAALLVQSITATLTRWRAGKFGDRHGHARLLIPALAVAALGMAAMIMLGSPVAIFAGMVLFGAGFGVVESATFALLIEQLPEARASALWNLAYDAGYGAGPAIFGLICLTTGYPVAFALTGALILATLPLALRERKAVPGGITAVFHLDGGPMLPGTASLAKMAGPSSGTSTRPPGIGKEKSADASCPAQGRAQGPQARLNRLAGLALGMGGARTPLAGLRVRWTRPGWRRPAWPQPRRFEGVISRGGGSLTALRLFRPVGWLVHPRGPTAALIRRAPAVMGRLSCLQEEQCRTRMR